MEQKRNTKIVRYVAIAFAATMVLLLLLFFLHVKEIKDFNATSWTIDNFSDETDVVVDIHPRGQSTDSWEKNDAFPDVIINGCIYEMTISNSSGVGIVDWSLRINIKDNCYVNNAWNGTLEIHQFVDGSEKMQTLSLQDYRESDLNLEYIKAGQDLLIPLSSGDYLIYYPDEDEKNIKSPEDMAGEINAGVIFYTLSGNMNLSSYELTYRQEKSIWDGSQVASYIVFGLIWVVAFLIFIVILILTQHYEERVSTQSTITTELLSAFAKYVDSKEPNMEGHSKRVADYSYRIARRLGMTRKQCEEIYDTALVHDIGKCYIPDYILKKPDSLTEGEYEVVKTHTSRGAEMLMDCKSIPNIADGAMYHHERYDGSGYPTGMAGEDIPLVGRIIAVADAYDVMNSESVYMQRVTPEIIRKELMDGCGSQFDPMLVEVFLEVLDELDRDTWEMDRESL